MAPVQLTRQMIEWLKTQPLDRSFNYQDIHNCAIATFLKESGTATIPIVGSSKWDCYETKQFHQDISQRLNKAVGSRYDGVENPPPVTVREILEAFIR